MTITLEPEKPQSRLPHSSKVVLAVLLGHSLLFWLLSNYLQPFSLPKHTQTPAIRVHFISQSTTQQNSPDSAKHEAVQSEQVRPMRPAVQSSPQPAPASTTKRMVSQQASKKITAPQPAATQATKTEAAPPATRPDFVQQSSTTETAVESSVQHTALEPAQGTSQHSGGAVHGEQSTNTQPPAQTAEAQPVSFSQVEVLKMGKIKYTNSSLLHQNRLLILTLDIDSQGLPIRINIKQSSGLDYLDKLVIKAAEKARFKPHQVNGQAVAIVVDYPFQLQLSR